MNLSIVRFLAGVALLMLALAPAPAQVKKAPAAKPEDPYRQLTKKPETAEDYWAALKFEIQVGKYNLAAEDLKGFLAKKPTDQELLQIEEREGMSAFLRLLTIPDLRADAQPLLERVTAVVKAHRSNPERIKQFIRQLSASPEEREFAIAELQRAGAAAVPTLVAALTTATDSRERSIIRDALIQLPPKAGPPLWAALDAEDPALLIELIDAVQKRGDGGAVVYLWHPFASTKAAGMVRQRAGEALAALSGKSIDQLPTAKVALVNEAERYYGHKARLPDPKAVVVWQWKDKGLAAQSMTPTLAEEYYGLKFARQALDLDPTYEPAQVLFVSLALEKAYERAGLNQPLEQGAPAVRELLKTINPDLLNKALDRALADHRLPVILGVVRALGELSDVRALRPLTQQEPALVRALYFPDRRVQFAASEALLRIPGKPSVPYSARIVEILRRALAADAAPRALVADINTDRANELAHSVQAAGFETVVKATGREVLLRLREAADIDVILIDAGIPDSPMPHLLAQLRADIDIGLLPILITIPADQTGAIPADFERRMERMAEPYRNVWVLPRSLDPNFLKQTLTARLTEAQGSPLGKEERAANSRAALTWLRRLAVGEIPGFDVRPAEAAILRSLQSPELESLAIETAGRLPGGRPQRALADAVMTSPTPALQAAAALELARHIRQHDLALPIEFLRGIEALYGSTTDAKLRANLALLLGSFRPSPQLTGTRLQRYVPAPPALPAPPKSPAPKEK